MVKVQACLQPFKTGKEEYIGDLGSGHLLLEKTMEQTLHLEVSWLDPQKFVPGIWYKDKMFRQRQKKHGFLKIIGLWAMKGKLCVQRSGVNGF